MNRGRKLKISEKIREDESLRTKGEGRRTKDEGRKTKDGRCMMWDVGCGMDDGRCMMDDVLFLAKQIGKELICNISHLTFIINI